MKTLIIAIAAVAVTGLSSVIVNAQAAPTAKVSYADLDLHTKAGMNTLHARLRNATGSVCSSSGVRDLAIQAAASRCRTTAMADAMKQLPDTSVEQLALALVLVRH